MKLRRYDAEGDYTFGQGQRDFWVNQPEGVGQYILQRLMLWRGQWFADLTQGVEWATKVLGERTRWTRDIVVRNAVQQTPGVSTIKDYYSTTDVNARAWTAAMAVETVYGPVAVVIPALPGSVPPLPPPAGRAILLGLHGGQVPLTGTAMEPANLLQPGQQNIAEFVITTVDGQRR